MNTFGAGLILVRLHHKSIWRWTDKIKWVASHEPERIFCCRRLQNRGVIGSDDLHPIDLMAEQAGACLKLNLVIRANVFWLAEKSVAMPGDSAVPGFP